MLRIRVALEKTLKAAIFKPVAVSSPCRASFWSSRSYWQHGGTFNRQGVVQFRCFSKSSGWSSSNSAACASVGICSTLSSKMNSTASTNIGNTSDNNNIENSSHKEKNSLESSCRKRAAVDDLGDSRGALSSIHIVSDGTKRIIEEEGGESPFNRTRRPRTKKSRKRKGEDIREGETIEEAEERRAAKRERNRKEEARAAEINNAIPEIYITSDGLRRITPYPYIFRAWAKERWFGRTLIDVFAKEFRAGGEQYYRMSIATGALYVDNDPDNTTPDTILGANSAVSHVIHRHEPPVSAEPIALIHVDEDVVVVNKPASVPVHPTGRYRHNSLQYMVQLQYGYNKLHVVHRLDRLTSGVMIFARNLKASRKYAKIFVDRLVEKEYVCRVRGVFPEETITCSEPMKQVSHKLGLCHVCEDGKPAETVFERVRVLKEKNESIVICKPKTGRTHQIRVHLKHLGHPIANDPLYGNEHWQPTKENFKELVKEMEERALPRHDDVLELDESTEPMQCEVKPPHSEAIAKEIRPYEKVESCIDCKRYLPDPEPDRMCIWLHNYKYKGVDWEYKAEWPSWAREGEDV
eukprot:Nk52_evm4s2340 gene=Nk52_evmTU4s2340